MENYKGIYIIYLYVWRIIKNKKQNTNKNKK